MNDVSADDGEQQNALTNSDLKGLLKAASMTEFYPDAVQESSSRDFEKSSSLFDLVRSNLLDAEPIKVRVQSDISSSDEDLELPNEQTPQIALSKNDIGSVIESSTASKAKTSSDEIDHVDIANLETSFVDLADLETNSEFKDIFSLKDTTVQSELEVKAQDLKTDIHVSDLESDNYDEVDVSTNSTVIAESEEFVAELKKIQITFDQKLDDQKKEFTTAMEALFGASQFIADQMENQISDVVLAIASDLAGTKIDEVPEMLAKKISTVATQIIGDNDQITIHLNATDYNKLKNSKNFSELKYTFLENQNLRRGEFEVISRKSSAGVSLFDFSDGE